MLNSGVEPVKQDRTHTVLVVYSSANTWYGLEPMLYSGVEPVKHDGTHTVVVVYSSTLHPPPYKTSIGSSKCLSVVHAGY